MDDNMKKMIERIRGEFKRQGLQWEESYYDLLDEICFTPYVRVDSKYRHGRQYLDYCITLNLLRRDFGAERVWENWEFVPDKTS